jgi:hypothetical protein
MSLVEKVEIPDQPGATSSFSLLNYADFSTLTCSFLNKKIIKILGGHDWKEVLRIH